MLSIGFVGFILFFHKFGYYVHGKFEPLIYGGKSASIEHFPHCGYISSMCKTDISVSSWSCGSSIINQQIILTAAHCVYGCDQDSYIIASFGKENKHNGLKSTVVNIRYHESYYTHTTIGDIAIGKLKAPLKFTKTIKRVALMRNPPYNEDASIAGWGLIDEDNKIGTAWLQQVRQQYVEMSECKKYFKHIPVGTLCAGQLKSNKYVAQGDSGSALVVRGFIQIGLVSYKTPVISRSLVVYTDVGYYYDWIQENVRKLLCYK